jgi:SAM-dependent methyltransferase
MDVATFIEAELPPAPARVLEVGCGEGALARRLASSGYRVVAIDPRAPEGDIFERVSLEDFADPGPFDAAVANRSLHHIPDLSRALDKVARLLRPGGRLIVYEHAWERMDEPTARWYVERHAASHSHAQPTLDRWLRKWQADHAGLHGYDDLRSELDRLFAKRYFAWTPYLYGELGVDAEAEERAQIEAGTIRATGFRYVGELQA